MTRDSEDMHVTVEQNLHDRIVETAQHFYERYGLQLHTVNIDWAVLKTMSGKDEATVVNVDLNTRSTHGKRAR